MPTSSSLPEPVNDEPVRLSFYDGTVADLRLRDGAWAIEIDGVVQSHLGDPAEPPRLASIRWMLAALGDRGPASCAHLGGGLLTLPRAIAHRWPASSQVVVELEPCLVELAETRFPLPAGVMLEVIDARAWVEAHAASSFDAIVIDIFSGNRIPPAFTSLECITAARDALAAGGRLVMNSVAGPDLTFTRRELATLRTVFSHVAMIVQGSALHGVRFGNATLIASTSPIDADPIRAALAGDPSRGALVTDLDAIVGDADPILDADRLWSPPPDLPNLGAALRLVEQASALGDVVSGLKSDGDRGAADR